MHSQADSRFAQVLQDEIPSWEAEGIITGEQAEILRDRYRDDAANSVTLRRHARMSIVMSVLGSLLVGVGVILVIASNWQTMPSWVKLAMLIAAMVGAYWAGFRMAHQTRSRPILGGALLFLGTLLYGASVFLVGQMFNIRVEWAHGLLVWGIGILPLAYLLNSSPILAESIFAMGFWIVLVIGNESSGSELEVLGGVIVLGVLLFSIGEAHQLRWPDRRLNIAYFWYGLLLTLVTCFALTFQSIIGYGSYGWRQASAGVFVTRFAISAAACALMLLGIVAARTLRTARIEIYFSILMAFTLGFGLLSIFGERYISEMHLATLFYHLLFAALILCTIALGIKRGHEAVVNVGLVFFAVDVIRLYFDWSLRLITGGLALIAGGVVLLMVAAIFEKARRRFAAQIRTRSAEGGA